MTAAGEKHQRPEANAVLESVCDFVDWPAIQIRVLSGEGDRFFPLDFSSESRAIALVWSRMLCPAVTSSLYRIRKAWPIISCAVARSVNGSAKPPFQAATNRCPGSTVTIRARYRKLYVRRGLWDNIRGGQVTRRAAVRGQRNGRPIMAVPRLLSGYTLSLSFPPAVLKRKTHGRARI